MEYLNITPAYHYPPRVDIFIMSSICFANLGNTQQSANHAFYALSEAMNHSDTLPELLGRAFQHLLNIGVSINNPDVVIFASAFNPETRKSEERISAIKKLYKNVTI